jgi:hypothetical protein
MKHETSRGGEGPFLPSPVRMVVVNVPPQPPAELAVRLSLSDTPAAMSEDEEALAALISPSPVVSSKIVLVAPQRDPTETARIPAAQTGSKIDDDDDDASDDLGGKLTSPVLAFLHADTLQLAAPLVDLQLRGSVSAIAAVPCCGQLHVYAMSGGSTAALSHLVFERIDNATIASVTPAEAPAASRSLVSSAFWYAVQSSRKLRPFDKYGQQLAARKQPSEGCRRLLDQLPPKPSNLTSTQQEQGFFKRLVTSSFDDQLVKVEQALLPTTAQTFEDLTDRILLSGPPLKRPEGEREALLWIL